MENTKIFSAGFTTTASNAGSRTVQKFGKIKRSITHTWLNLHFIHFLMRFFLIFLSSSAGLFAFFYFYPAAIFQATVSSSLAQVTTDISLKTLLYKENFPNGILAENVTAVSLTTQGILLLIICVLALPLMIAYRYTKTKS